MSDLETRQLRYFVAVAEELHFGRAAERLGMAQPPLSRAIRQMERELGVALLTRTTRQVALTPAGEALLDDARTALDAIAAAGRRARHLGQPAPRLRLALKADIDGGLLPAILDAYSEPVELVLVGHGEQARALRDGRADVGLLPSSFDGRGLDAEPLLSEPVLVALAAADPLAARESLALADLAGRALPGGAVVTRRLPGWAAMEAAPHQASDAGWHLDGDGSPHAMARHVGDGLAKILRLVELGDIICFIPLSVARRYQRPEIAYRPVSDLPPMTLAVAWPEGSRSPAAAAFVRAATKAAAIDLQRVQPAILDSAEFRMSAARPR
jgi:DNA-binding transcriptional LysR family regulator